MKSAWLADIHLNLSTYGGSDRDGLAFRTKDMMRSLEWAITTCLAAKVQAVFMLGDIYDDPDPANNVRSFLYAQLQRLLSAGVQVHLLVGNHDARKEHHALQPLQGLNLPNLSIYYKPTHVRLQDGTVVLVFPHSESVERQEQTLRAAFLKASNDWWDVVQDARRNKQKVFLAAHLPIFGARQNSGHADDSPDSLHISDLESLQIDNAFLGDFHGFQILKTETKLRAMYVGSLENTDFGDLPSRKGFVIYDTESSCEGEDIGVPNIRFVQNPNLRRMFCLKASSIQDINEWTIREKSLLKDAIIKIDFTGNERECLEFAIGQRDLIRRLENDEGVKLIRCEKNQLDAEQDVRLEALQAELDKVEEAEFNDIGEIIQLALKQENQVLDAEEQSALNLLAQDIVKTVRQSQ